MTADLGSPRSHAGPCTLTSPKPSPVVKAFLRSLISRRMPRLLSLPCCPPPPPGHHTIILFPVLSWTSNPAIYWDSVTPILVSYWFARGANRCWRYHSVLRTNQRELSSTLPLIFCFLYKPGFPAGGLFCLPPVFTLVSCSVYFFDPEDGGYILLRNVG
jgi:hypothetical protein